MINRCSTLAKAGTASDGILQKIDGLPHMQRPAGMAGVGHGRSLANIQAVKI